jgi:hypothetical protein
MRAVLALTPREWEAYRRLLGQDKIIADNHCPIAFYKGQEIIGVAYVEFVGLSDAIIHGVATDNSTFNTTLQAFLAQWIKSKNRKLVG